MKVMNALVLSAVAGIATFSAQHYLFPAPLHAATFVVPQSPDWRQEMIDRDPGGSIVDQELARLTDKLDLSADQIHKFRPLLEKQHERILALLLTAPASLTRAQFLLERQQITDQTHRAIGTSLTPDQAEIARELHRPANP